MTTENNKIIAEFIGWESHLKNGGATLVYIDNEEHIQDWEYFDKEKEVLITPIEMKFHSDWNWLMEVVEKIESLGNDVLITSNFIQITYNEGEEFIVIKLEGNIKIFAVYTACLEFIKWHEQNK